VLLCGKSMDDEQMTGLGVLAYIPPKPNAKHQAAVEARARARTPSGVEAKIERTVHAKGAIAELKRHGLTRARSRGKRKLQLPSSRASPKRSAVCKKAPGRMRSSPSRMRSSVSRCTICWSEGR